MRNQGTNGNIIKTVIILLLTAAILLIIVNSSGVETTDDAVVLKGLYGKTIPYSSIISAALYETDLPAMMARVNGIGLGFIDIGHYRLKDIGAALLFILKRQKPYLLLRTAEETILIGMGAEKNKEILKSIQSEEGAH